LTKKFNDLVEEVHDGLDSNVKEISEKILSNMAINYAVEERKNVLIYYYNDERVSIHVKAVSAMSILQDKFAFLAVSAPSEQLLKGHNF
jgi:aromatic ring-cleaving dioxygenase